MIGDFSNNSDNAQTFTRRALFVGALQIGALAILGGRLAWLQLAQGAKYKTLADKNRISMRILAPLRGQIVDRFGVPLAVNNQNYRVQIVPEQTDNLEQSLRALQKILNVDEETVQDVIKTSKKTPKFLPIEVKDNLNWDQVAKVELNLPDLPGLSIDVGKVRSYPFGTATAHVIGYVSAVNKAEIGNDPLLSLPGFNTGKTGIEKVYDLEMRGKPGASEIEVNVVGREVRELSTKPAVPGDRVILTLDAELQRFAQQRLEQERSASAVVMDVHTGAIYALASAPAFDPNNFTRGIPASVWEELLADIAHPLTNKAVAGQYPPGSTFKMVTALAGLETGAITPSTRVFCPGHYEFGDNKFHCWKKGGHGTVDVVEALSQSCDVFFYKCGLDIGIDKIAEAARRMGLGSKLGFELQEERPGLIPDKNWKLGYTGESWQQGETIVASIGQGYIQTTPLQLAIMTARLVNGGKAVEPWITGAVGDRPEHGSVWPDMKLDPKHLQIIQHGMYNVINDQRGTAYAARIKTPGMEFGGKTGTAQVRRITKQQRAEGVKNEDLPWQFRHHALFVGYAPVSAPKYVTAVVVEHGVGGSSAAAPLARDLLQLVQERDPAATPLRRE